MSFTFNPFTSNFDSVAMPTIGTFSGTSTANGLDITGTTLTLHAADGTNPGAVSTTTQTFAGAKTFSTSLLTDTFDSSGVTLGIGGTTATTINIGRSGTTINMIGTTIYENVTNLQVADKLITINKGGAATTGFGSGLEIEENSIITGYIKTSADRNSWTFLSPNTAGIVTITPGAGGFTIDQGSHNPITLAAFDSSPNANGASLSGQVLTLQPASGSFPGGVSTTTQTFAGSKTFSSPPSFTAIVNTGTLTLPTSSDTLVGRATTDTLTNKTLTGNTAVNLISGSGTFTFNTTGTITAPNATDTLVGKATTDTLTNKTISTGGTNSIGATAISGTTGTGSVVFGTSPSISAAAISGATTITDAMVITHVGNSGTQLAFSLTQTAGTVLTLATNSTASTTLNLPAINGVETLVGRATTDTLTNKTIAAGSNTISGLTNTNLSGSAGITNANLANSSITIGSTNIALGATSTTLAGLTSVTSTTFVGSLTGSASGNLAKATGDIDLTTFSPANNTASPTNVTGLAFANGTVRSAHVIYSVFVNATSSLYEQGTLHLVQKGASWDIAQQFSGDNSLVTFTVTTAGQVQYTTPSYAGFVSAKMGFRALVTQV